MKDALLSQLSRRLARPVDESERLRARLHLLDWLACVAGARNSDAARVAAAISDKGWERATYLGNVLEMDDVHRTALLHPGPVVWPAAMSVAGATMEQRLDAAVRGYEAMIAVGAALDAHHYAHWHPSATAGVFGSAAAFGSLLEFDAEGYANALGNSGSVAGGFWHMRHDNVSTKQWHIYHACRTGIDAARHAKAGASGPLGLIEGPQGLFATFTKRPGDLAGGEDCRLMGEVSFKPFAACRHAHPAIDAAMQLREAGKLSPPFKLETYADALAFCDRPNPKTELEAKFSLQHAIALVADGRDAKPEDFTQDAIAALAELRDQVCVAEDPAISDRYPDHFGARVNGFEVIDTLGDPERPMSEEQISEKMIVLADWGGVPRDQAERAIDLALKSENTAELDTLLTEWTK